MAPKGKKVLAGRETTPKRGPGNFKERLKKEAEDSGMTLDQQAKAVKDAGGDPDMPPKQGRLPSMEDTKIAMLEDKAEEYAGVRDRRMGLSKKEGELKDQILQLMKANDKKHYHRDGIDITIVHENEKVKVRIGKDDDEGEQE